jgi:hypothetical protein
VPLLVLFATLATVGAQAASPTMSLSPHGVQDDFDPFETQLTTITYAVDV